jgi:hypothetical protein
MHHRISDSNILHGIDLPAFRDAIAVKGNTIPPHAWEALQRAVESNAGCDPCALSVAVRAPLGAGEDLRVVAKLIRDGYAAHPRAIVEALLRRPSARVRLRGRNVDGTAVAGPGGAWCVLWDDGAVSAEGLHDDHDVVVL